MSITSGYELSTSITNIFIFIVSIIGFFKVKKDKLWRLFFLFMSIDSFLGVVVHGIVMSELLNNILWVVLCISFTISINILLSIFLRYKIRYMVILSCLLLILLLIQFIFNMDYLFTFTMYVLLAIIVSVIYIIKDDYYNKKWFLLGFLVQLIGGVLLLSKLKISLINHNGIYHLFMAFTLLLFYIGIKTQENYDIIS